MKQLRSNSHIIQVFGSYTCGKELGILLLPVANGSDLRAYLGDIKDAGFSTQSRKIILVRGIGCLASGLAFIHKQTIRHKDIKPQNILIHDGRMIYTDFGISLDATHLDDTTTTGYHGACTERYCAPEVANSEPRNRKSDVFSLGCVFIEILTVLHPKIDLGDIISGPYWQKVEHIRNSLAELSAIDGLFRVCHAMLEPRSADRIGAEELFQRLLALQKVHSPRLFCDECAPNASPDVVNNDDVTVSTDRYRLSDDEESVPDNPQNVNGGSRVAEVVPELEISHKHNLSSKRHHAEGYLFDAAPNVRLTIFGEAIRPLNPPDLRSGHIYIFSSPGMPGLVRIGYARDVSRRIKEFQRHCKLYVEDVMQNAWVKRKPIPHARRVDKLVRTEMALGGFQYLVYCAGCYKTHTEWFRIKPEHATRIIKKFSDWMATNPYQSSESNEHWELGDRARRHGLKRICKPVPVEA